MLLLMLLLLMIDVVINVIILVIDSFLYDKVTYFDISRTYVIN